jgi:hypothetical protein
MNEQLKNLEKIEGTLMGMSVMFADDTEASNSISLLLERTRAKIAVTQFRDLPTREEFAAYEKVRKSGKFNMFDSRAIVASRLSREKYMTVLKNYDELMKLYPEVRK